MTEEQSTLQPYTPAEALAALDKQEQERKEAYEKRYINKELDTTPKEYLFTGVVQFEKQRKFKQKDGTEKANDVWHFESADKREFTTSNFQTAREILTALKNKKYKISLAHKSQKGTDGNFHDAIVLVKAE